MPRMPVEVFRCEHCDYLNVTRGICWQCGKDLPPMPPSAATAPGTPPPPFAARPYCVICGEPSVPQFDRCATHRRRCQRCNYRLPVSRICEYCAELPTPRRVRLPAPGAFFEITPLSFSVPPPEIEEERG